jgi:hypothetical protein
MDFRDERIDLPLLRGHLEIREAATREHRAGSDNCSAHRPLEHARLLAWVREGPCRGYRRWQSFQLRPLQKPIVHGHHPRVFELASPIDRLV